MKKFIMLIDSLVNTFSIIESGKNIEFNYQEKDNPEIFRLIQKDDSILGYYPTPLNKIKCVFTVKQVNSADTITLNKKFEVSDGVAIEPSLIDDLERKTIVEISDSDYDTLINNMTLSSDDRRNLENDGQVVSFESKISEDDFRLWLSKQVKKNGDPLSDEFKMAYYYILKAIPSMLDCESVFAITSYENFESYRQNIMSSEAYKEANPNVGSGTLSAALTQYGNYLAERNLINISEDQLAQILKDWYDNKYVENNITSTLVGYGFKYAQSINNASITSKALLDVAKIESTMAAYIDRGKDLYAAMKKSSIGIKIESKRDKPTSLVENFDYGTTKGVAPKVATNKIFYGTPGCGKSYHVDHKILGKDKVTKEYIGDYRKENIIRTTFYQDYSNTDFVGQILPKIEKDEKTGKETVKYIFNPGPFTLALIRAISNPSKKVALVIEEINRGNAPAIFGDIFQLLDRDEDSGISEYGIVNVSMLDYLNDYTFEVGGEKKKYVFNEIKIPGNMDIFATMNASDQNVYTLDTAFVRRWDKEKIKNSFEGCTFASAKVPGMDFTWQEFVNAINNHIAKHLEDLQVNEDKQIGAFFVKEGLLKTNDPEKFAYKVFDYLWSDVAKLDHSIFFNPFNTLEALIAAYVKDGVNVFKIGIFDKKETPQTVEAAENNE